MLYSKYKLKVLQNIDFEYDYLNSILFQYQFKCLKTNINLPKLTGENNG